MCVRVCGGSQITERSTSWQSSEVLLCASQTKVRGQPGGWQAVQTGDGLENRCFQSGEGVIIGRGKKERMNEGGGCCLAAFGPSRAFRDDGVLSLAQTRRISGGLRHLSQPPWL